MWCTQRFGIAPKFCLALEARSTTSAGVDSGFGRSSSAVFAVISKLKKEVNNLKKKVKPAKGKEDITDKPSSSEDKPGSSEDKPGGYRKGYRKVDISS